LPCYTKTLALMLAAAFTGYLSIIFSKQGIITACIHFELIVARCIITAEII